MTALYTYGLRCGGLSVWLWGWVISWLAITVVSFSMAEICTWAKGFSRKAVV
jgi:hypothetical protein